jgi:hypothetical protein
VTSVRVSTHTTTPSVAPPAITGAITKVIVMHVCSLRF